MNTPTDTTDLTIGLLSSREFVLNTDLNFGTIVPMGTSTLAATGQGAGMLSGHLAHQAKAFGGVSDFERASLVYFRGTGIGKQGTTFVKLVQLPLYFSEIKQFTPISGEDLLRREAFALTSGFVLFGPDECLAIFHATDEGYTFCEVFENNDEGVLRNIAGVYAENIEFHSAVRSIAEKDAEKTKVALSTARGDLMWWLVQADNISKLQRNRMLRTVKLLEKHAETAKPARTESGAIIVRSFMENAAACDTAHMRPREKGWVNYPTWQQAWYFGIWVNKLTRETLTFAEQDVRHVMCENDAQFAVELKSMADFYGNSMRPSMMAVGDNGTTVAFDSLTFLSGEVREICFDSGLPAKDETGKWVAPIIGAIKLDHPDITAALKDVPVILNRDNFELNLLDPRSFEAYEAILVEKANGLAVRLTTRGAVFDYLLDIGGKSE